MCEITLTSLQLDEKLKLITAEFEKLEAELEKERNMRMFLEHQLGNCHKEIERLRG